MNASDAPRTIRFIDIENLTGTGCLCEDAVRVTQVFIDQVSPRCVGDHEVLAVSHERNAPAAFLGWNGSAQFLLRPGHDGADLALLAELENVEFLATRYNRVVIASGDHAFAPTITALKAAGIDVLVIGPVGHVARQVRLAAGPSCITYVTTPTDLAARHALAA
ncbi:hypothetical protein ABRQ22_10060 [Cellulosimicrobium sp. ES-005]|uniref:NYN domain-containing protein n=1 Tax=Cellulosimicrobium sp. ES-005 TaxID=3163031 RepID=A0AAU8G6Y4_9MICO